MRHNNGLKTSLPIFFFLENAKNLGRSDDAKRTKKRRWPNELDIQYNNGDGQNEFWNETGYYMGSRPSREIDACGKAVQEGAHNTAVK